MSKRNLITACVALAACMCWALGSTLAEPQNSSNGPNRAVNDQSGTATDSYWQADWGAFAGSVESWNPDVRQLMVRQADMNRVKTIENPVYEPDPAIDLRTGIPCQNIAYRNGPSFQISVFLFGGNAPNDNCVDDLTLPPGSPNGFVCAAKATTLGFQLGGPPTYNLLMQLWNECPEDSGAILLAQGTFLGIPNDKVQRTQTITVDPPYLDSDSTFWLLCQSNNPDAAWEIARNTGEAGDVGTTLNLFGVLDGVGDCGNNLFFFGGNPWAGFTSTLLGSEGPQGSCCALEFGTCQDGVLQGACANFQTQSWSTQACSQRVDCVACNIPACPPGSDPNNLENEPDCFTNYNDVTNRGCQNLTLRAEADKWTPISFGAQGCGRTGTYTYLNNFTLNGVPQSVLENRVDGDWYKIDLTQATRVTWTVRGKFPSQAIISFTTRQTNGTSPVVNCPSYIATSFGDTNNVAPGDIPVDNASTCDDAVVTVQLPGRNTGAGPYRYFVRANPSLNKLDQNGALCGLPYTFKLAAAEVLDAGHTLNADLGACCTKDGCVVVSRFECMLLTSVSPVSVDTFFKGVGTNCGSANCPTAPTNDLCPNYTILTCTNCAVPFDTTFATSSGQIISNTQAYYDLWYRYNVGTAPNGAPPPGCNNGRIAVSTIGACFNMRVTIMRISNCNAAPSVQCAPGGFGLNGNYTPTPLLAGPPVVNVGPFVYNRTNINAGTNTCFIFRIGGLDPDADFGPGVLRLNYVCNTPAAGWSWAVESGRCCLWDETTQTSKGCHTRPLLNGTSPAPSCAGGDIYASLNTPICCAEFANCLGYKGYLRNQTDFYEGATPPVQGAAEIPAVGCETLPCPGQGDACYNAWNLNSMLGGGFGTVTRLVKNRTYFKYVVPNAPVGSGITLNLCGSSRDPDRPGVFFFDTAMAVFRGFDLTTGECGTSATDTGNQACTNTPWDGREVARGSDCNATDPFADGAQGSAHCYGAGELNPCLCLKVVSPLASPGLGEVRQGDTIYIGAGLQNTYPNSLRPFVDILRADDCSGFRLLQLQVTNPASCFVCNLTCPGGSVADPEPLPATPCTNYVDQVNAGCSAELQANVLFQTATCGTTYCGTSAVYRTNKPCATTSDCDLGDVCDNSFFCTGPDVNTQDNDWWKMVLTQPQRLTWTVTAAFPATLQIISSPTNDCLDQNLLAQSINIAQCTTTTASVDVCGPTTVYLTVIPTTDLGNAQCGLLYYATLTCSSPTFGAGGCCKGDMDNNGFVNGKDIKLWLNEVLPPPAGQPATILNPVTGCFDVRTCRADFNLDFAVTLSDLSGFVSALLATNSCGATVCGDSAACHLPSGDGSLVVSDLSVTAFGGGYRVSDDFRITSGTQLSKLCWYGGYFNYNTLVGCAPSGGDSPDDFRITIYDDNSGLPGKVIAGPVAPINMVKTNTGVDVTYLARLVRRYRYEADLPAAVNLTPGVCYWLEIVNTTTGQCLWHWETSQIMGNGVSAQKNGGPAGRANWYSFDLAAEDFSWCMPGLRIENEDCGLPLGQCCIYPPGNPNGSCVTPLQTQPVCESILGGRWFSGDCNLPCPIIPVNDFCADAQLITTGPIYRGSTIFATKDGPVISCEQSCGGGCNSAHDVWYKWVAGLPGATTFSMCAPYEDPANYPLSPATAYDGMMVVYIDPANGQNGCPNVGGQEAPGGCNDDGCDPVGASTVSKITSVTATAGRTYWIRITGWQGTNGNFAIQVRQP